MSKIALSGDAAGTGTFTIASPNSNSNRTLTLPDSTGTVMLTNTAVAKSQLPTGSVLQVVSAAKTDTFSLASSTFTDITGLSVTITPTSATSKILIMATTNASGSSGGYMASTRLVRDSTAIYVGDAAGSRLQASVSARNNDSGDARMHSMVFLDSPATTSAITYKVQLACQESQTICVNRSFDDLDVGNAARARTASSITVMEIAA
jgi:hypothetical protein